MIPVNCFDHFKEKRKGGLSIRIDMLSDSSFNCVCIYIYRHYDFSLFLIQYIKIAPLKKILLQIFNLFCGAGLRGWI